MSGRIIHEYMTRSDITESRFAEYTWDIPYFNKTIFISDFTKGQLISVWIFDAFNFPKKQQQKHLMNFCPRIWKVACRIKTIKALYSFLDLNFRVILMTIFQFKELDWSTSALPFFKLVWKCDFLIKFASFCNLLMVHQNVCVYT